MIRHKHFLNFHIKFIDFFKNPLKYFKNMFPFLIYIAGVVSYSNFKIISFLNPPLYRYFFKTLSVVFQKTDAVLKKIMCFIITIWTCSLPFQIKYPYKSSRMQLFFSFFYECIEISYFQQFWNSHVLNACAYFHFCNVKQKKSQCIYISNYISNKKATIKIYKIQQKRNNNCKGEKNNNNLEKSICLFKNKRQMKTANVF